MKNVLFLGCLLTLVSLFSCKGDPGDPGPAGVAGQDGNANINVHTVEITSSSWQAVNGYENIAKLNVPIVTADVASKGLVMVYFRTSALGMDGTTWTALPFSLAREFYTEAFGFTATTGQVTLRETSNDGFPVEPAGSIRIVTATADGLTVPIDWNDYRTVANHFDLELD